MVINEILNGDVIEMLKGIPDGSVNTCVTSPPYWGLRDYGKNGQIGAESSPDIYVSKMVDVFNEVKRVLKDDGTLWLNLGDTYANTNDFSDEGIKRKDLIGIPWRVALALQSDGWFLRSDIIWSKPNPMPSSVKDRPTTSHEYIFLLTKNRKYYYDHLAVLEEAKTKTKKSASKKTKYGDIENEMKHRQGLHADRGETLIRVRPNLPSQKVFVDYIRSKATPKDLAESSNIKRSKIDHWFRYDTNGFCFPTVEDWQSVRHLLDDWGDEFKQFDEMLTYVEYKSDEVRAIKEGYKNRRSVWNVATKSFKGAHFATYPPELIEPCILAGCPENGVVLDPFFGSGTTGFVAKENNRNFIGVELNPDYVEIAKKRIGIK
jgi:DNA modification methylase